MSTATSQLIAAGESQTLEFKASFDKATIKLYGGLSLSELDSGNYKSRLRNKLVAEAFYLTGNIEKYGSGFIRIRKALLEYPEIKFSIEEKIGGITATFIRQANQNSVVSEGVSEGVSRLLALIREQPGLRAPALAATLQTSPKNIERWLKQLKDRQLVEFRGTPKAGGYHPKTR